LTGFVVGLFVVTGPPAAGKSTWVVEHARAGDIVVDLDRIAHALTVGDPGVHEYSPHVLTVAHEARRAVIARALPRMVNKTDVYLIHSMPDFEACRDYRGMGGEVVVVDPGRSVVNQRIAALRPARLLEVADRWYDEYSVASGVGCAAGFFG
jgi:hypothetical protein